MLKFFLPGLDRIEGGKWKFVFENSFSLLCAGLSCRYVYSGWLRMWIIEEGKELHGCKILDQTVTFVWMLLSMSASTYYTNKISWLVSKGVLFYHSITLYYTICILYMELIRLFKIDGHILLRLLSFCCMHAYFLSLFILSKLYQGKRWCPVYCLQPPKTQPPSFFKNHKIWRVMYFPISDAY